MKPDEAKSRGDNGRLDKLEDHAVRTEDRLNIIEKTQSVHGDKLDQIVTAVTRYDSRPVFDLGRTVSMVRDCFAILAVCATFGVWYVSTLSGARADLIALEVKHQAEKTAWLESKLNFVARIETIRP